MVWQIPDAVDTVVCTPDDGWKYHPKHVEQFPDINKLCNTAYCWIYIGISCMMLITFRWKLMWVFCQSASSTMKTYLAPLIRRYVHNLSNPKEACTNISHLLQIQIFVCKKVQKLNKLHCLNSDPNPLLKCRLISFDWKVGWDSLCDASRWLTRVLNNALFWSMSTTCWINDFLKPRMTYQPFFFFYSWNTFWQNEIWSSYSSVLRIQDFWELMLCHWIIWSWHFKGLPLKHHKQLTQQHSITSNRLGFCSFWQ